MFCEIWFIYNRIWIDIVTTFQPEKNNNIMSTQNKVIKFFNLSQFLLPSLNSFFD